MNTERRAQLIQATNQRSEEILSDETVTSLWIEKINSRKFSPTSYMGFPPENMIPYAELEPASKLLVSMNPRAPQVTFYDGTKTLEWDRIGEEERNCIRNSVAVANNGEIIFHIPEVVRPDGAILIPFRVTPDKKVEVFTTLEVRDSSREAIKKNPNLGVSLPMGHFEENEDPLEGAVRELKEETGIQEFSQIHHISTKMDNYLGLLGYRNIFFYAVEMPYGQVIQNNRQLDENEEIHEGKWRSLASAIANIEKVSDAQIEMSGYAYLGIHLFKDWVFSLPGLDK